MEAKLPFPIRGISERMSHQEGDAQTTPYAINVFPDDAIGARTRGGSRPGLTKRYAAGAGAVPTFMEVVTTVNDVGEDIYQVLVVATANGIFASNVVAADVSGVIEYTETLTELTGNVTDSLGSSLLDSNNVALEDSFSLGTIERGQAVAYQSQVLIARGQEIWTGPVTISGNVITSPGVDWSALGINASDHLIWFLSHSGAATNNKTYTVGSVLGGSLTIGEAADNGTATATIILGHKLFNPVTKTISLVAPTGGFPPTNTNLVTIYRDRAVWVAGRVWYMSRQGAIGDYDYGGDADDAGRAVAGLSSDAGQPGDPIVALAPGGFDYLVMFAEDTTWVMRGDPAFGGFLFNLSRTVGCVDSQAWCYGPTGEIFFLSKHGLCVVPPDMSKPPEILSQKELPRAMQDAARSNYSTSLSYDHEDNGVAIFITPHTGESGEHWWFDIETASFWKMSFADDDMQPVESIAFSGTPARPSRIVMASRDGYIRQFSGLDDDGEDITSKIVLGPYEMNRQAFGTGLLATLMTVMGEDSGDVTLEIYTGDTAEDATAKAIAGASPRFSRVVTEGRSKVIRPRVRCAFMCVVLRSLEKWSFELVSGMVVGKGSRRF